MKGTDYQAMSMFVDWMFAPRDDRGFYLADDAGGWQRFTYRAIAKASAQVAAEYRAAGVQTGDVVCLTAPTTYDTLISLFGVWLAGATICPLPEPSFQSDQDYVDHIGAVLRRAEPAVVVTSAEIAPLMGKAMAQAGMFGSPMVVDGRAAVAGELSAAPNGLAEIALLQFTSGSTGNPQGVRVSWDNLAANFAVLRRWTRWAEGEGGASWLPLYHDMGLIGCLLPAVATQSDLWLMRPLQFIRDPGRWLSCFGPGKARHAASPSFAFAYLARRITPDRLVNFDLSAWRSVIVGAEVVDPLALAAFARFAAPAGFASTAFVPAYGLAENTLGVTSPGGGQEMLLVRPDWASMGIGEPVRILEQARFSTDWATNETGWLVGHGSPVPADGIAVRVIDEDGTPLPAGHLGEIAVTGSSVALGYHGQHPDRATRFSDGVLRTGDAGFFHGGELFVVGRMGDSLKLRGRNVYVEDLDAKVAEAGPLNRDRVAVVSSMHEGRAGLVVFAEARPGSWTEKVTERLRGELGPEPHITIVTGRRGMIRRTSSGKPRRRHMWQLFSTGGLKGAVVIDTSAEHEEKSKS
ncbi:AMP-binding protein [Mycobacterium riyadhense]|uniref:Fatty-acid--CoA ligase fadD21 n=1 Tax=Mycobacterium riyadhense TaxID=486698 RepID=A0A653ESN9_9MYCO|nr:AMP-binding protein [Mycobacterium riyadhense]VTP00379.1 Putative fatty-acid--CoA ligase fadD21 [Mycobacterium riyadhense]